MTAADPIDKIERYDDPSRWDEALRRRFPGLRAVAPAAFTAAIERRVIADRALTTVTSNPMRLTHQAHPSYDPIALLVQLSGEGELCQRGQTAQLVPGCVVFLDTQAPTQLDLSADATQRFIELPARFAATDAIARATLATLDPASPLDAPLITLLAQLWLAAPTLDLPQQRAALDALDATLRLTSAAQRGREAIHQHARFERAAAYIRAQLAAPDLDAAQVASAQHISRRSLDAIFATRGWTIARFIWEQRLLAASAALRDPALAQHTILDIALTHGFSSASHFSRAYRARFGHTPSAARAL